MSLPDGTALTAAGAFITSVWDANPMLGTLFGIIALLTIGFYALRRVASALPR